MIEVEVPVRLTVRGPFITQSTAPRSYGVDAAPAREPGGERRLTLPGTHLLGKLRQAWEELAGVLEEAGRTFPLGAVDDWLGTATDSGDWAPQRKRLTCDDFVLDGVEPQARLHYRIRIDRRRLAVQEGAYQVIESPFPPGAEPQFVGSLHSGQGGKAELWDAHRQDGPADSGLPGWCPEQGTAIEASVAIDRLTRTARDRKLFHRRVVAPGTRFRLVVTGANLEAAEVAFLVAALGGFDEAEDPITLGAEGGSGKGRLALVPDSLVLQRIAAEDLLAWLDDGAADTAMPAYRTLTAAERAPILAAAAGLAGRAGGAGVALAVDIRIDGPFLVNDPPPRPGPEVPPADRPAAQRPRRDHAGRTLLPAKSVRGVLRARAERIIRTLGGHACRVDDPGAACDAIAAPAEVGRLCLACRVFGAPGWRSPLAVTDFSLVEQRAAGLRQEFVAIDRFTGGGVERLKFSAQAAVDPHFSGTFGLDLRRGEPWMAGLLALVLRDLCEGDLSFGCGAAKGYGAALGSIGHWRLHGLEQLPAAVAAFAGIGTLPSAGTGLTPPVAQAINEAVRAFRDQVAGVLA